MDEPGKPRIGSHRDLIAWRKAMDLTVEVYRLSGLFPKTEVYRLSSQITRAAASVPANIAEGRGRSTRRDYGRFLAIAKGSLMEVDTFLILAIRLNYLSRGDAALAFGLVTEVSKMVSSLRARLIGGNRS